MGPLGFADHRQNGPRHCGLSRRELAQNTLARGGKRSRLRGQTSHDAATADRNARAKRAHISTTCRPQDEQLFARPHRSQHQRRRSCRGCARTGGRSRCRRAACCGRCAAAGGVDRLLAGWRDFRLVLLQTLQRRGASGRHAGADLLIIGAARTANCGNLCAAWLFGRCACGGLASCRCRGFGRRRLGLGRSRRLYRAHGGLTA